jgi:hypothetical protein
MATLLQPLNGFNTISNGEYCVSQAPHLIHLAKEEEEEEEKKKEK